MTRFPITRYAFARLLVLLTMRVLPADAEWPRERLHWVDHSLGMTLNRLRGRPPWGPGESK